MARGNLGDAAGGLEDTREAIEVATLSGREIAMLQNNLGVQLWRLEGPAASLEAIRAAIAFAQPRGLTEMVQMLTSNTLHLLVDTGAFDEALELADDLEHHLTSEAVVDQILVRSAKAQVMSLRGQAAQRRARKGCRTMFASPA